MTLRRTLIIFLAVTGLLVGGVAHESSAPANASIHTTDITWQAAGAAFESQEIDQPANVIGLTWTEGRPTATWYRVKQDGRWTGWIPLQIEGDHGPDLSTEEGKRSKPGSDAVWVGESEAVQFRTTGSWSRDTEAVLINTSRQNKPILRSFSDFLTPRVPAASGAVAKPLIHPRSEWDPSDSCEPKRQPTPIQVTHAFVHHTSTNESENSYSKDDVPDRILGICLFHTESREWNDIGYNFLIDKYGRIWEGRAGGIENGISGAHTAGFNGYSVGVAFIGHHTNRGPSAAAEKALQDLLVWKADLHNTDMAATTKLVSRGSLKWERGTPVPLNAISGHRDAQETSCPGEACYKRLPDYRDAVNERWSQISLSTYVSPLVADFDGDGSEEAAVFRTSDGHWLVTQDSGATSTWADFSTAKGWSSQVVGDFNGDGKDDIANFHPSNGTWWISTSTGRSFNTRLWADFPTANGWSSQLVGDFNGDDKDDIANFHPSNGTWWISTSTGSSFNTRLWADFSTATGWTIQLVGDFNGDGRDDITNRHVGNGTWWTVESSGDTFSPARLWGATTTYDHLSHYWVQDVDKDSRDDVLTVDAYNGFIERHMASGSSFDIAWVVDTPWRTTIGGKGPNSVKGTHSWLYFGQEFQWMRVSDLDRDRPGASTSIVVTLPRP